MSAEEIRRALEHAARPGLGTVPGLADQVWAAGRRRRRHRRAALGASAAAAAAAVVVALTGPGGWMGAQQPPPPAGPPEQVTAPETPSPAPSDPAPATQDPVPDGATATGEEQRSTDSAGECSAVPPPDSAGGPLDAVRTQDLPAPVLATAEELLRAAAGCDSEALVGLAERDGTTLEYLGSNDPAALLAVPDEEDRYATLALLLARTRGIGERQEDGRVLYLWPAAMTEEATDGDWQDLVDLGLLEPAEAESMRTTGYAGWFVGVREADGSWALFVGP